MKPFSAGFDAPHEPLSPNEHHHSVFQNYVSELKKQTSNYTAYEMIRQNLQKKCRQKINGQTRSRNTSAPQHELYLHLKDLNITFADAVKLLSETVRFWKVDPDNQAIVTDINSSQHHLDVFEQSFVIKTGLAEEYWADPKNDEEIEIFESPEAQLALLSHYRQKPHLTTQTGRPRKFPCKRGLFTYGLEQIQKVELGQSKVTAQYGALTKIPRPR